MQSPAQSPLPAQVSLGWLHVVGYLEVIEPREILSLNLLWDLGFHLGVACNEEISMRGWLLIHTAMALHAHSGLSPYVAMASSVRSHAHVRVLDGTPCPCPPWAMASSVGSHVHAHVYAQPCPCP